MYYIPSRYKSNKQGNKQMKIQKVFIGCPVEYFVNNLLSSYKTVIARELQNGNKVSYIFPCLHKAGKSVTVSVFPMYDGSIVYDIDSNS